MKMKHLYKQYLDNLPNEQLFEIIYCCEYKDGTVKTAWEILSERGVFK